VHILVVNEHEAAELSGIRVGGPEDAAKAAEALIALGVRNAVVTLGANGSVVHDGAAPARVPAFRIEAVDATAAGDTFCGALAVKLTEGASLAGAARFATAAAALACTRLGAQSSIPARREIDAFLREKGAGG
jgi:ribokinase